MAFKISVCIATMDRWSFLQETIPQYLENDLIDEIVISDENGADCMQLFKKYGMHAKLRLYSNRQRLGAFLNKARAVSYARNSWVCVADSDNFIPRSYFEAALRHMGDTNVVYMPSWQKPYKGDAQFDNRKFIGHDFTLSNVLDRYDVPTEIFLQSGNYICAKSLFLSAMPSHGIDRQCNGLDALYKSYLILKAGGVIRAIPGMEYGHSVHDGSITLQSFKTDFGINKILIMNLMRGLNPWRLTLLQWMGIAKPLSQWLVNCSEFTHCEDHIVPFPIGMSWQIAAFKGDIMSLVMGGGHSKLLLCNVYPTTDERRRGGGPKNRHTILSTLSRMGIPNTYVEYDQYITSLKDYKFSISPEGNGIDTHRTYEALMTGCIPIVEESEVMRSKYPGLPILWTNDYSELTANYLESHWLTMLNQTYDFSPLLLAFYDTEVQTEIKKNSDYWCAKVAKRQWMHYE